MLTDGLSPGLTTSNVYTVPKKGYLLLLESTKQCYSRILDEILVLALERERHASLWHNQITSVDWECVLIMSLGMKNKP